MKKPLIPLWILLYGFASNSFFLVQQSAWWLIIVLGILLYVNTLVGIPGLQIHSKRMKVCSHGCAMMAVFPATALISVVTQIVLAFTRLSTAPQAYLYNLLFCIGTQLVLFWNGVLCLYLTSYQLGVKLAALFSDKPAKMLVIINYPD